MSPSAEPLPEAELARARELLAGARRVVVLTGAGFSAESGVPTFRGPQGLWRQFRPEELATPEAFARDPRLVWEWYEWRRGLVAQARPNPGHEALVRLEARVPEFLLATQNVDGLHQLAGSQRMSELHGSIWRLRCCGCGDERLDRAHPLPELPPRCGGCGGLLRPGVVWYGESLPLEALQAAVEAARACDLAIVAGTSAVVYPAAGVATAALQAGRPVLEINPERTELSGLVAVSLRARSGEVLPLLVA